ncbi:MAG: cytochrome ubiquinol oxidase subunit I [Desulfarculus sp.]|nr:cytochrome ubiquinol oxidase subunit I [Desulfarculus sp.]
MNYPVWELGAWGGGWLIALIAVAHVYVAHFAVGGGLFLVLTETMGRRTNDPAVLDYTRRHAKFFLLLTMVFGGLSGVGIWLVISVLHPSATSVLIHDFVFAWATEWVFFLVEIVSLFVYYYTFDKMVPSKHLLVGWIYAAAAWVSLLLVNGIISFMLTPGGWLTGGGFWPGFLNPSLAPSTAFRTFLALVLAGVYGLLTAVRIPEPGLRTKMVRWCAAWLLLPFLLMLAAGWWSLAVLPESVRDMLLGANPEMIAVGRVGVWLAAALFLGGLLMVLRLPRTASVPLAALLLVIGLFYMGSFEWAREAGRRPYIIYGHMYSNSLLLSQMPQAQAQGVLKLARWSQNKQITPENRQQAGRELYNLLCSSCHSVGGPMHDLLPLTAKYGGFGLDSQLDGMGKLLGYMPPFAGTRAERQTLADYIVRNLHGKQEEPAVEFKGQELPLEIPPFDAHKDAYVLLCWNDLGMHCLTDDDQQLMILPPANTLQAQLIKRGETPKLVSQGVEISYAVEPGHSDPAKRLPFWRYAKAIFGKELPPGVGLAGKGLNGSMDYDEKLGVYEAKFIPVSPYPDAGGFNPYPLFTIEAKDKQTGQLLARTRVVAPVSSEVGCRNCHGGGWRVDNLAGMASATGEDILATHDRINRTDFKRQAAAGKPVFCASCHADPALGMAGDGKRLSFSAAIHGWHANYLTQRGAEACQACHPDSPSGPTRCLRGLHVQMGQDCTNCHGFLEDHALGLLKGEQAAGKPQAAALMRHLQPRSVASLAEVNPRAPWVNQPDCLNCHRDFAAPEAGASGFNRWTKGAEELYRVRGDEAGVKCAACHGSPHALYPAKNPYGRDRDVVQPRQYQGNALPLGANQNCKVCHTVEMDSEMHHPNSLRMVRSLSTD